MNAQLQIQTKAAPQPSFTPVQTGLLQRKCACGQHTIAGGECAECRQKREGMIQLAAVSPAPANAVPPIVHDVLSSRGQPLDAGTRAFMEPRFGHDFSQVRVHTDAHAAESARAVNALAYTVERDVVFGTGQYAPTTSEGRRLVAHELTHVMQQQGAGTGEHLQQKLTMSDSGDPGEREAKRITDVVISGGGLSTAAVTPTHSSVQCAPADQPSKPDKPQVPHSDYKPTASNCARYRMPEVEDYLGSFYQGNASSACIGTPDEVHNNCVRHCLQPKLTSFIEQMKREGRPKASQVQLPPAEGVSRCRTIWEHHVQCYRECGCQNSFIDFKHFFPMCDEPFSPEFVTWSISRWNPCMGSRTKPWVPPYIEP